MIASRRILAIAAIICTLTSGAKSYWQSVPQVSVGAAPTFQGAGDVVPSARAWGSCARAYTAAIAATQAAICDIVDTSTGASTCTLHVGTNGFADLTSLSCAGGTLSVTTFCTVTHVGCSITKVYDQTGLTNCTTACHWTQATLANMPVLDLGAINSLPCMKFPGGTTVTLTSPTLTSASQPYAVSSVGKRTSGAAFVAMLAGGNAAGNLFSTSASNVALFAGTVVNVAATDNAYHAVNATYNGASSIYNIDGATATVNPGVGTFTFAMKIGNFNSNTLTGDVCEVGIWGTALVAGDLLNLNSNQHGASGYNF